MHILYEDNHLIAINKKSGELAQGDKTGDASLLEKVKAYIKTRDNKPGNVFLGLIHRLDRPTSGLILFAKTSKALERMNTIFKNRSIQKTYWALTESKPDPAHARIIHYLRKNPKNNKVHAHRNPTEGAKEAITEYRLLRSLENYHLLEVEIFTGRSHQIRAQLAAIGCIIRGDLKYGAKRPNKDKSISLHARSLKFEHPVQKKPIHIIAPVPKESIWQAAEKLAT